MNNSQALKNLKQSAKKQTEELKNFNQEIHQENWKKLSKDLTSITNKKLNKIEESINSKMIDIQNQNKRRYSLKAMIWTSVSIMTIGILVGIMIADYTPRNQNLRDWKVPKAMKYIDTDGKYIMSKDPEYSEDKKTVYIKIGE